MALRVSVLGESSLLLGMKVIRPREGLPPLPDTAVTVYSGKSSDQSLVRSLSDFISEVVSDWQKIKV